MDELLEQFLLELRELVAQAVDDLLALERNPGEKARIDGAFRAFHTLKGAAGIVDFDAMATALHAAEDELSTVRAGGTLTSDVLDACLSCLDQVGRWLDAMERTGTTPAGATEEAAAVVRRFGANGAPPQPPATNASFAAGDDWLPAFLARHPDAAAARTAIRYRPDPEAFFRNEDPVAFIAAIPGILVLDLDPSEPWPSLEDVDPFRCTLGFSVLSTAAPDVVRPTLDGASGQVVVLAVPADLPLSQSLRSMLEAQLALVEETTAEGLAGRICAAGSVAGNALRHSRRPADAAIVSDAMAISLAAGDPGPLAEAMRSVLAVTASIAEPDDAELPSSPATAGPTTTRSLRVDVDRIEALVSLAGELIVLKNAIGYSAQLAASASASLAGRLKEQHAALDRLSDQLRDAVLGVRVIPFGTVFQRFPRIARDLGISLGKEIVLTVSGETTEADKAVVEALFEPLLHVVRNAADHGIEMPEVRRERGKSPTGTIRLAASREGEQVVVVVSDDGSGMDVARIRALAAEREIVTPAVAAAMSDTDAIDIVFAPGFSTAAAVTDLSGRGVGLDSVRSAVERLGGRVTAESRPGEGSSIVLRLPPTVMVSRLMIVEIGEQPFGIPLDGVVETTLVDRDRIRPVGMAKAFVRHDRTIPLIDLREALGRPIGAAAPATARVVVVSVGGGMLGAIEVDRLGDRLDAIVKPIGGLLRDAPWIAGTTLLGDGRVLIVLDLEELLA